jgi:cytochrome c oxidase subunit IV
MATESGTSTPDRPAPDSGAVADSAAAEADHDPTAASHDHPSELAYIKVALFLAIVTALEVAVYYVPALEDFLVPILLACGLIKFVFVVAWFMHLRFDSRIFRRLFVVGVLLAMFCYTIVLTTFHVWTR